MIYKIIADIIVIVHFIFILFMLSGIVLTIAGFFREKYFKHWLFRTLHLCGILFVAILAILGKYCPLTILENLAMMRHNPDLAYPGSFIVHYIEELVYPNVDPMIIIIPTVILAVFTLVMFIIKPPFIKCSEHI